MARERVVTRTINRYDYECLCYNTVTKETETKVLSLTGDPMKEEKALKELQKTYGSIQLKVLMISSVTTHETIYGMKETDFIRLAKPMDSERHFVKDKTDTTVEVETDTKEDEK